MHKMEEQKAEGIANAIADLFCYMLETPVVSNTVDWRNTNVQRYD